MKNIVIVIAALIMATVLVSGYVNINFQHNLHLPPELTNKNTMVVSTLSYLQGTKKVDFYLNDIIRGPYNFRKVIEVLDQLKQGDLAVFHIAGNGGEVDTTLLLINHIRATKATTVMIVEAPSYSGHAYLATSGQYLVMYPYTFLMFHTSSAYGFDCNAPSRGYDPNELDRTRPNSEHCLTVLTAHLNQMAKLLIDNKWLTPEEKVKIYTGYTIILDASDPRFR